MEKCKEKLKKAEEDVVKWASGAEKLLTEPDQATEETVGALITQMSDSIVAFKAAHEELVPLLEQEDAEKEIQDFEEMSSNAEGIVEALQEMKDTLRPPAKPARKTGYFLKSVGSGIKAEAARRRRQNLGLGGPDAFSESTGTETQGIAELKELFGLLTAPKVDISKYNQDPLKNLFCVKAFKDNVERVIQDEQGSQD